MKLINGDNLIHTDNSKHDRNYNMSPREYMESKRRG